MSRIEVRADEIKDTSKIDEIGFSGLGSVIEKFDSADNKIMIRDYEEDAVIIHHEDIDNLIAALQKAKELWVK